MKKFRYVTTAAIVLLGGIFGMAHQPSASQAQPTAPKPAMAQPSSQASLAVVGGYLIDGSGGPPLPDAVILIQGEKIVGVGRQGLLAVPQGAKVIDANGFTVMPGLIDTHVHLDVLGAGEYPPWHDLVRSNYAEVMRVSAAQLLAHGITTARDAGGELKASVDTRDRINRGELKGPRMLISGGWIEHWPDAQAAGYYRQMNYNIHNPEEARQVTHDLIAGGADGIKLYTGLTVDEIRASSDEAHKMGKFVGRHAYTDQEIQDAIKGGVDFIDHAGSGHQNPLYTEETLRMMVARNIPAGQSIAHRVTLYPAQLSWPERLDNPELRAELGKYAEVVLDSLKKPFSTIPYFGQIQAQMSIAPQATRQLHDAGVKIIMGTDSGTPGNFHSESVWREMEALVRMAGLTPMETIIASTRDAAAALKVNTGVIMPGRFADIILVKGNPLDDVNYTQNVVHVIKAGVQYK